MNPSYCRHPWILRQTVAILLLTACAVAAKATRVFPRAGTSSADFLKIGVGARPIGMGEAFTAVADDANAVYWNPAGLAGQTHPNFGFMHNEFFQGLKHEFLGYVQPIYGRKDGSALGTSLISLSVPDDLERRSGLNETDFLGQQTLSASEGTFGAYNLAVGFSYARFWREKQSLGASVKYVREAIDNQSAQTAALDLGWKSVDVMPNLDVGAVIQHLGPGTKFKTRYPLPLTFKLGGAYLLAQRARLALDVSVPRDDYPTFAFGSEVRLAKMFMLRAGYRYRWYGNPLGAFSGFRSGVGFMYNGVSLDYSFAPFGDLGNAHRISLGMRFGKSGDSNSAVATTPTAATTSETRQETETVHVSTGAEPAIITTMTASSQIALAAATPALSAVKAADPGEGYTRFQVWALPKVVSAKGTDFLIQAQAPGEDWPLQKVEFRSMLPTANSLEVQVRKMDSPQSLPEGWNLIAAYSLRLNIPVNTRAVAFDILSLDAKTEFSILAFMDGQWKPLKVRSAENGGKKLLRAQIDSLPEVIAVASRPLQTTSSQ